MAWPWHAIGDAPSWFGGGFGEVADTDAQPAWRDLEIGTINFNGTIHRVRERRRVLTPFTTLTDFDCEGRGPLGKCLVVMPLSGHFALFLRDLIAGLLSEHDVSVLDWTNARHIPLDAAGFGFEDSMAAIVAVLRKLGPDTHLVGVCQSAVLATVAAIAMHQTAELARPVF